MIRSRAIMPSAAEMIIIEGYIEDIAPMEDAPPSIVKGIVWQESKFDKLSYTYDTEDEAKRNYGLMHLSVPTAQEMAGVPIIYTDLFNPMYNIMLGSAYLKKLYDKYGSWEEAVAAYNAGSVRFTRAGNLINQNYVNVVMKAANVLSSAVVALAKKI